jgi:hypothetical protein
MADITPLFAAAQQPPAAVPDASVAAGMQLVGSILHDIAALQSIATGHHQVLETVSDSIVKLGQGMQAVCAAAPDGANELARLRSRVEALEATMAALTAPAVGSA